MLDISLRIQTSFTFSNLHHTEWVWRSAKAGTQWCQGLAAAHNMVFCFTLPISEPQNVKWNPR